jgi:hypothetical protein
MRVGGLKDGYYVTSHGAIVCCDMNCFDTLPTWCGYFRNKCPNASTSVCCFKSDIVKCERQDVFCVSNKTKEGVKNVLNDILQKVTGDRGLMVLDF